MDGGVNLTFLTTSFGFFQRFTKNTFYIEKNPTIVNFPVKNIDLSEYLTDEVREDFFFFLLLFPVVFFVAL